MACQMGSMNLQWRLSITEHESSKKPYTAFSASRVHGCCCEPILSGLTSNAGGKSSHFPQSG